MPTTRRPDHAPAELDLVLDFVNVPLEGWLAGHGPGSDHADGEQAAVFRHAVRGLLAANADLGDAGAPLREFNATLRWLGAVPTLLSARRTGIVVTASGGVRAALGRLVGIILGAVNAGTFPRLKLCANPDCSRAFYDHGRNAAGRWCDMTTCGNRAKVAAHRSRHRSADPPRSIDEAMTRLTTREPRR